MRIYSSHPGEISHQKMRSHSGGMIFLHINSFCRAAPPKQDCSFGLDSVCFYKQLLDGKVQFTLENK